MPQLPQSFPDLLRKFGVVQSPNLRFSLLTTVLPVAVVDPSDFTLEAPFTVGSLTNPGVNTVLADSGPRGRGTYRVRIETGVTGLAGNGADIAIQRRNAANGANIWQSIMNVFVGGFGNWVWSGNIVLEDQERIRVFTNAGGTGVFLSNIWIGPY